MFKENQSNHESKTVIGASVNVEGDFKGQGDVLVEGTLKGSLSTEHDVTVGSKATVEAGINAKDVFVSGTVRGNIKATGHVTLTKSAHVSGDVSAKTIAIETGAEFNGNCSMASNSKPEHTPDPGDVNN
ncbi:MAG: bactofilin family protein [Patescibacteria group bacterium]